MIGFTIRFWSLRPHAGTILEDSRTKKGSNTKVVTEFYKRADLPGILKPNASQKDIKLAVLSSPIRTNDLGEPSSHRQFYIFLGRVRLYREILQGTICKTKLHIII